MTEEMTRYYARRAREYERVYTLPAWQTGIAEADEPRLRAALRRRARHLAYDDLGRFWIATWETA